MKFSQRGFDRHIKSANHSGLSQRVAGGITAHIDLAGHALRQVNHQNDFCAGGALAVAEGDSTVDVANALIAWCKARGEAVVASQDWHPADHGSFASQHNAEPFSQGELDGLAQTLWPDHCVQQTEGAQLHPLLNQLAYLMMTQPFIQRSLLAMFVIKKGAVAVD